MKSFNYINSIPIEIVAYIGKVHEAVSIKSLYGNSVFHIQGDKNDVILKVSDSNFRGDSLWNEYSTVKLIYEANTRVPVPKPHSFYVRDNFSFFIEEYLTGSSLRDSLLPNRSHCEREIIIETACLLKAIHEFSCMNEKSNEFLEQQLKLAEKHLREERIDYDDFTNKHEPSDILKWLRGNKPSNLRSCLLHGDFRPKNILWNGNRISGIIDWEHSFYGDPYYDIAILFYYLNEEEKKLFIEHYGLNNFDSNKLEYFSRLSLFLNI